MDCLRQSGIFLSPAVDYLVQSLNEYKHMGKYIMAVDQNKTCNHETDLNPCIFQ